MVFEAEDLIGVEELRRDQDESYSVDLKAAVPRRVTDAFRKMQDRCRRMLHLRVSVQRYDTRSICKHL